ncbi:Acyl-CoA N-acyltransferase [Venturia nashicola]|nr:Acyl-CoA N-acyltransferase [Venturia nashicola]
MHLVLSRVQEDDFDELLEVQFRAFADADLIVALLGRNTPETRALTKEKFIKDMKEDSADCWMKLVDTATGRIVSAAQWKIYPSWAPLADHGDFEPNWLEGKDRETAEDMVTRFMTIRAGHMYGHSHVLLYILFTDPNFQRCGAGSIHVKWGTELADRLLVPCWVEGSAAGHHLYEENGFKDVQHVNEKFGNWSMEYTVMRRESKTQQEAGRSIVFT